MTPRAASRVAWCLWALSMAMLAAGLPLTAISGGPVDAVVGPVVAVPLTATVGALILSRVPANALGWVIAGLGLLGALAALAAGYADYTFLAGEGSRAFGELSGLVSIVLFFPTMLVPVTFVLLLFPNGRLLSRRWRPVAWLAGLGIAALSAFVALNPEAGDDERWGPNPFALEDPAWVRSLLGVLAALTVPAILGSVAAVIVRFRRARGVERQQVKWLAVGGAVTAAIFLVGGGIFDETTASSVATTIAIAVIPASIGVAILRYRLYDIDLLINRTVVYGLASAGLAGLYFGIVLALQQVFSSFAGGSDLAIAGSTLAVAALFRPVRRRVQTLVDRRFYRRRYDAQRTLEAFSARLRDEIDLDTLTGELETVVERTLQPAHVSLWLAGHEARR